jgi:hypothetical protein
MKTYFKSIPFCLFFLLFSMSFSVPKKGEAMIVVFLAVIFLLAAQTHAQECMNKRCRMNDCFANEYQDMQCTNGTRKCCDKSCSYATSTSCGATAGCFLVTTRTVTTPAGKYRTDNCANSVSVSNTPCTTNCADCVETWSAWGACSVTCGNGSQSRSRTTVRLPVGRGRACSTLNSESRFLCLPAAPPCPIPCVVGPWSDWSPCNGPCLPALRQRVRNVVTPALFGGSCDVLSEVAPCPGLPPCEGSTMVTTPFPTPPTQSTAPTMAPITLPPSSATFLIFNHQLTGKVIFGEKPNSLVLPNALGSLVAVVMNATGPITALDAPFLTSSSDSLGCQIPGLDSADGEILAPTALRFLFDSNRAFARIVLAGFNDGESALLVGFDRSSRKRDGETISEIVIELQASDQSFAENVGFDTWELRPAPGSSIGLQTIEVFASVAALPTPATTTAPFAVSGDLSETDDTATSDALNEPDVVTSSGEDQTSLIIALCVAFGLLAIACLFVWWVVRRRNREREREAVRHFSNPNAFSALQSNGNMAIDGNNKGDSIGSYGHIGLRPHYEQVGQVQQTSDDLPPAVPSAYSRVPTRDSQVGGAADDERFQSARYESFNGIDQAAKVGYRDFLVPGPGPAVVGTQYGVGDLTREVAPDRASYTSAPHL